MTVRLFKDSLRTVVEPLRLLDIIPPLGVALGSLQIGQTREVLQADAGVVGVAVHGGRVAGHQVDGRRDVVLPAQPLRRGVPSPSRCRRRRSRLTAGLIPGATGHGRLRLAGL